MQIYNWQGILHNIQVKSFLESLLSRSVTKQRLSIVSKIILLIVFRLIGIC